MSPEGKQRLQLALIVAFAVAGIRTAYIFYQRHEDHLAAQKAKSENVGYSNPDYYVSPKKLYPYDLKSARQLTQQPVWVREGYRYTYYPYQPATHHVDFVHEAGLLLPIEKLAIVDVMTATPPGPRQRKQVMAVFRRGDSSFAVPIGLEADSQFTIYSDEMFFIEDPHDLYKHWTPEVWSAVDQHEVKPGMNELQAVFAIGMGVPDAGDTSYSKTVHYPNGGKPLVIVYHDGKAADIQSAPPGS